MPTALLSTTYFGPVQWYQKLVSYDQVVIDPAEPFVKQTYRNRCVIATTHGPLSLTIPVVHGAAEETATGGGQEKGPSADKPLVRDIRISDHGNWRHLHWNALVSAYGESPFFEYYADDLRPFFERRWEFLYDFNMEITLKMCELLDISSPFRATPLQEGAEGAVVDFRTSIRPKRPLPDAEFVAKPYYQVFRAKHGFLPNLSILDLLFNMGNESILFLS